MQRNRIKRGGKTYGVLTYTLRQGDLGDKPKEIWSHLNMTVVSTQETGRLGEDIAAKYLRLQRYRICERNVRFGRFEIDIIAFDKSENMMVFVEVKTRTTVSPQYPIHTAVDKEKRK